MEDWQSSIATEAEISAMRLGRLEFFAMNNWLRQWLMRTVELPLFMDLLARRGVDLQGKVLLDAGCGSGFSTQLLCETFQPSEITAFDLMPEQIALARRRNLGAELKTGDLTSIDCDTASFDGVFLFGVLHHIAKWRGALAEIVRVLRPGGVLLVEEPRARFTFEELELSLEDAGLKVLEKGAFCLGYFHSYLCKKA